MNLKYDRNIMYIMVVGFHHKKGCQLEYVYPCDSVIRKKSDPDFESSDLYELPKKWKHVPSLALPDGSHNYDQDYIYFHLEDIDDNEENKSKKSRPNNTIFGVSCYRQIDASEMLTKDSDVTRNTLQKSVCILSRQPIYSSLRLKLHSITTAYFAQKDFHKTQILQNAFHSLSSSYTDVLESKNPDIINEKSKFLIGLSLGDLVLKYQHKILILFKLLLLEKKCLYQIKPVSNLSNTIMALVSLIPDLISLEGLEKCSGYFDSIDLVNSELDRKNSDDETVVKTFPSLNKLNRKMNKKLLKKQAKSQKVLSVSNSSPSISNNNEDLNESKNSILNTLFSFNNNKNKIDPEHINYEDNDSDIYKLALDEDRLDTKLAKLNLKKSNSDHSLGEIEEEENIGDLIKNRVNNVINWSNNNSNRKSNLVRSDSVNSKNTEKLGDLQLTDLLEIEFGMPINIFNEFNILHPYLSLYYLDYFMTMNKMRTKLFCTTTLMMNMMKENRQSRLIEDEETVEIEKPTIPIKKPKEPTNVGYTIGATNVLFKQRLYDDLDAFIDDCEIDLKNNESLKKLLQLTTADLRFTDYLIKNVNSAKSLGEKLNNTPTLLSFKKTSSFSNFDPKDVNDTSSQSSTWEGSDDWIRLNFKWYLYSLLGCIVKEDNCTWIKNDLENILVNINNDLSSSSSSLDNEVVDIDDYIEKVNTSGTLSQEIRGRKNRKNSTSSASTISSSQYFYIIQNSSQFSNYREDFNSNFVNELKKTCWFKKWLKSNKTSVEKNLLKFDNDRLAKQLIEAQNLNQKFQTLFQNLQEIETIRLSHPFNGQMSVSDIKLKFNFLFTTTESGRKINKALSEGSKLVNNTGKAVGDALSQAKSSFSSFLSSWSIGSNSTSSNSKTTSKNFTKI
ncbi:unnamed protein product [Brachionus calyciflorus]|uniref:UDENN domain-containing protein n=1 Tax=Brachionus calyciflorus TaxID=104777 RepID=A0A814C1B3_9BILA|nr:unnamed protein product [Brachionus calyciflorus]